MEVEKGKGKWRTETRKAETESAGGQYGIQLLLSCALLLLHALLPCACDIRKYMAVDIQRDYIYMPREVAVKTAYGRLSATSPSGVTEEDKGIETENARFLDLCRRPDSSDCSLIRPSDGLRIGSSRLFLLIRQFSTGFTSVHGERSSAEYAKRRKESLETEFGHILGAHRSESWFSYHRFGPFLALYRAAIISFYLAKLTV
ncbi:hypothetical protein ZIOFF_053604 [Zingiber officinale]|uniref:Uncharacterized protein n=1 Tax=Zingiber officinale TaxID=94328 RepID=A0A8J5KQ55_ZINOF|nr:hypothetical protein ZIOFF_053604 [Zingiber officinale]